MVVFVLLVLTTVLFTTDQLSEWSGCKMMEVGDIPLTTAEDYLVSRGLPKNAAHEVVHSYAGGRMIDLVRTVAYFSETSSIEGQFLLLFPFFDSSVVSPQRLAVS